MGALHFRDWASPKTEEVRVLARELASTAVDLAFGRGEYGPKVQLGRSG